MLTLSTGFIQCEVHKSFPRVLLMYIFFKINNQTYSQNTGFFALLGDNGIMPAYPQYVRSLSACFLIVMLDLLY